MKKHGNFLFTRRMVVSLFLCLFSLVALIPCQIVKADSVSNNNGNRYSGTIDNSYANAGDDDRYHESVMYICDSDSLVYTFAIKFSSSNLQVGIVSASDIKMYSSSYYTDFGYSSMTKVNDNYLISNYETYHNTFTYGKNTKYKHPRVNIYLDCDKHPDLIYGDSAYKYIKDYVSGNNDGGNLDIDLDSGHYSPASYDKSLGFLAGVELQQIHDKSKEKKGSPDGSGLMETIVYNDKTTTGVDLKNGDYKIEVAWANAYLNAKSTAYYAEDKKKTSICTFDAKLNCKSADSLKRYYYSVLDANKKCKDNSTSGFEPNMFTIITKHLKSQPTYWYRIISKDNKYSGWVKIGVKGGGVDDITFPQDTYDNEDNKVDSDHGGYHKDNSKEAIGSGDSKDEAIEDSVADSQRKDDNNIINNGSSKDLWDSLKEFVKGVESVPIMIADLFSFLPSWCLGLVASGFALMIALMIINCIKS